MILSQCYYKSYKLLRLICLAGQEQGFMKKLKINIFYFQVKMIGKGLILLGIVVTVSARAQFDLLKDLVSNHFTCLLTIRGPNPIKSQSPIKVYRGTLPWQGYINPKLLIFCRPVLIFIFCSPVLIFIFCRPVLKGSNRSCSMT